MGECIRKMDTYLSPDQEIQIMVSHSEKIVPQGNKKTGVKRAIPAVSDSGTIVVKAQGKTDVCTGHRTGRCSNVR